MYYYDSLLIQKLNTEKDFDSLNVIQQAICDFVAEYVPEDRLRLAECLFKSIYPDGHNSDLLAFLFLRDDTVCGHRARLNPSFGNKEFLGKLAMRIHEALNRKGLSNPIALNIERENITMDISRMDFQKNSLPLFRKEKIAK